MIDWDQPPLFAASHARDDDPEPSHAAARAVARTEGDDPRKIRAGSGMAVALEVIASRPDGMTADEVAEVAHVRRPDRRYLLETLRRRCSDLLARGMVEAVGSRRGTSGTSSPIPRTVYRVTPRGCQELRRLAER